MGMRSYVMHPLNLGSIASSPPVAPRLLSTVWCNLAGPAEPKHYLVDPIGQISVGVSSTSHDHCLGAPSPTQAIVFYGIALEVLLFPLDFESHQTYSWSCTRCSRDHLYGMRGIESKLTVCKVLYSIPVLQLLHRNFFLQCLFLWEQSLPSHFYLAWVCQSHKFLSLLQLTPIYHLKEARRGSGSWSHLPTNLAQPGSKSSLMPTYLPVYFLQKKGSFCLFAQFSKLLVLLTFHQFQPPTSQFLTN